MYQRRALIQVQGVHAHLSRQVQRVFADALGMRLRLVLARVERCDQRFQRDLRSIMQAVEQPPQLRCALVYGLLQQPHALGLFHQVLAPLQSPLHAECELGQAERLQDVIERANAHCVNGQGEVLAGGEHQNANSGVRANNFRQQLQPAHSGHADVGEHQLELSLGQGLQGRGPVVGQSHLVSLLPEMLTQQSADWRFVVYDQDARIHGAD